MKHLSFRIFLFFLFITLSFPVHAKPAPGVSGMLSIVPGLGQVANGNAGEGAAWFSVIAGGLLATRNRTVQTAALDLWMYNMYDAYRDAGATKSAKHNVVQNYIAWVNPMNVWGPWSTVPLMYQTPSVLRKGRPSFGIGPNDRGITPFAMGFVALGEEGLFRGFIFPGFSDMFGSVAVGAVTSSVFFAAAHTFYAGQRSYALHPGVFTFRTLLGIFYCAQTYRDKWDLRKSIFSHAWVDILYEWDRLGMFGGGSIAPPKNQWALPNAVALKYEIPLP